MSQVFGTVYSDTYDLIYQGKNYSSECDLLESILRRYALKPVRYVLDLGCGTGNHSIPLAQRGYKVTGIDRSEAMLQSAMKKAHSLGMAENPKFVLGDVQTVELERKFDAVLIMFAVLGYQNTNKGVMALLQNAYQHLAEDGLVVFDFWYGPAVLAQRPSRSVKSFRSDETEVTRTANGTLDVETQLCTVEYELIRRVRNQVTEKVRENHIMRFFFPQELNLFLEVAGFKFPRLSAFPDWDRSPDETTWNALGIAQKQASDNGLK